MGYDCYSIGNQTNQSHIFENVKILKGDGNYGSVCLHQYINHIKPDIVVTLNDVWNTTFISKLFPKNNINNIPHIGYFAYDSEYVPPKMLNSIMCLDNPMAMSYNSYLKFNDIGIKCDYIQHGTDNKKFYPLDKEKRMFVRRSLGIADDEIVVGYVSKNQFRKMLDRVFRACANIKYKYKIKILAVTNDGNSHSNWEIDILSQRYGIEYIRKFDVTDTELNDIYNAMDVHMLLTSGEGFGLTLIESQSAGVPNITTDYTSGPELINDGFNGYLVKASDYLISTNMLDRALADVDEATLKLKTYLELEDEEKQKMRDNSRQFALQYDWDKIIVKWDDYIKRLIGEKE